MAQLFAEIIIPRPLDSTFTYGIPDELISKVAVGHRVVVSFGQSGYLTGIVASLSPKSPDGYVVKDIVAVLDEHPVLRHPQIKIWRWIADYYMCAIGDVYKAAVPSGLKVESETFVELNPDFEPDDNFKLSETELLITECLRLDSKLTVGKIEKKINRKRIAPAVSNLIEKGVIIVSEAMVERYRPVKIVNVKATFSADNAREAFEAVKGAPKQEKLLLALMEMTGKAEKSEDKSISKQNLLNRAESTQPILNQLIKKGLVETYTTEINRFKFDGSDTSDLPQLTEYQQEAYKSINEQWKDKKTVLLHGVTASGKTEIYARLIDDALRRGEQVLYLVPEIALTTQLTHRLQRIFGDRVIVYHSKFTDNERVDIWKKMLSESKPWVFLGARSSVFLPFGRLGLVIVDEEHETSYKQTEPAPRYNARDVAILLASMHGAHTLLGSATPSVETYYKALNGKFGLVEISRRYDDAPLPPVRIVDMTAARKKKEVSGILATETIRKVNNAVGVGNQAILFRNRRGFSPIARCKQCAWIPKCRNCDVTLTYHNHSHSLVCHYCGTTFEMPKLCPLCHQPDIETVGYGTERIEEDLNQIFPQGRILRMDLDTTRNKNSYENIIDGFSRHNADILVGTQMVTKGLDFNNVSTVAVLSADELINVPDFKSNERAYNMLEQVAGRAGRRNGMESEVIIQTYQPEHYIFPIIQSHDYKAFYNHEIEERRTFSYPPFSHLIYIYLRGKDAVRLAGFAESYATALRRLLGNRVTGPNQPKVSKIKSLYIQKIMLKIEYDAAMSKVRDILKSSYREMASHPDITSVFAYFDVDP